MKHNNNNLILVIGKIGVGKTTIAKRIALQLGYKYLSTMRDWCSQRIEKDEVNHDIAKIAFLENSKNGDHNIPFCSTCYNNI